MTFHRLIILFAGGMGRDQCSLGPGVLTLAYDGSILSPQLLVYSVTRTNWMLTFCQSVGIPDLNRCLVLKDYLKGQVAFGVYPQSFCPDTL